MADFRKFYLRLTLVQGLCLAAGFWINAQVQSESWASLVQQAPKVTQGIQEFKVRVFKANVVIFLGTWGLLAGVTGLMLLREQRASLLSVLESHTELDAAELTLVGESDSPVEAVGEETSSLPEPSPGPFRLRLAMNDDDFDLPESRRSDEPACLALSTNR